MTTTANTLAWLDVVRNTRPGNLTYDDWSELHGMLHDLIHIDDVDALRAALRDLDLGEAVEVQGWQPIETAPTDGYTVIDLWSARGVRYTNAAWDVVEYTPALSNDPNKYGWTNASGHGSIDGAGPFTHWMPLPAAPDAKP